MGVPVCSFDDFVEKLKNVEKRSAIFGFLLFDSRPSQDMVTHFTQNQGVWIDELARGAGIYFFFPLKSDGEEYKNPSPSIARIFNVSPSRLPGIILFAPPGKDGRLQKAHAVYVPLEKEDFNDPTVYEPIFMDLFEEIRLSMDENKTSSAVLKQIKERLVMLRKRKYKRGFARYIRKSAHLVFVELPKGLYDPMAQSFGKTLGERIAGGST